MLSAQATLSEAQTTIAQYEGLLTDYKTQVHVCTHNTLAIYI